MTSQLFIRLSENSAHTCTWGVAKEGAFSAKPAAALSAIAQYLQNEPNELFDVIVLLPGNTVFSTIITVPEQQAKYLQQSLPFLVEESLTDDIADMYLVLSPKVERNQYVVMGIARAKLEQWLADLKAAQINPRVMVADHTCCPADSVIVAANTSFLRLSEHQSQSIDTQNLRDFLTHYLSGEHIPVVNWLVEVPLQAQVQEWLPALEKSVAGQSVSFNQQPVESVLAVLAQQYLQAPAYYQAINFLQGKYKQKTTQKTPLHRWRQVGVLVVMLLVLYWVFAISQGLFLSVKTTQLEKQSKQFYKELFPADTVTDNVRAQMTGKLKAADSSSGKGNFLEIYSQVVTTIQKNQLQPVLDVTQVSFNDDNGEVHIELLAKNIEQITQLKELLVKEDLKTDIGSTSNEAGKTKASLKIWQ